MAKTYKRGGMWYCDLWIAGKRVRKALSEKKPIADKMLDDLIASRRATTLGVIPSNVTWGVFKAKYLVYSATKDKHTHYRDQLAIRTLEETFPITHLKEINPELFEHLKAQLLNNGKKKPAINRCLSALKAMMRKAESWKYIESQDWRAVSMLKTPQSRLIFYSIEELQRLENRCKGIWKTMFMLGYYAGLRPDEKRKLEWSDVHWNLNKLHIREAKGNKERWVPMQAALRTYLESIRRPQEFVLGDDMPNEDVQSAYWRKLIKNEKLKGSEYTLRHSFASHLVMNGVPLKVVSEMMGHSSIKTTEVYAHLSPESFDHAIGKLPNLVTGLCQVSRNGHSQSIMKDLEDLRR